MIEPPYMVNVAPAATYTSEPSRLRPPLIVPVPSALESFKVRLENYYAQTQPLVDFYKEEGIYHHFDGMVGFQKVSEGISSLLQANK